MITSKNSAKAIILQDRKILLIKKQYEDGRVHYTLPGGTQEPGETLEEALVREVFEEIGAEIMTKTMTKVYEHSRPSRKQPDITKHKIEFAFLCELKTPYTPRNGLHPDSHQVSVEWIDIDNLKTLTLDPEQLAEVLQQLTIPDNPFYLGRIQ
ncbi:NUDIX domain-containing protein [Thiomicrorhabdus sp. ZW0627]|uniref:NUDIX domain-containing protein n=1 Tax=Thiomicrorhabdus sp. ZW0627 TaxID=3039774 RepID=UPI0024371DFB|nr:NUDIX domain-containing protein [Thiomicrorhabdus sp. ZW0627]MDG6774226.1 NUDIX domain-containing protein [Thiomicrorhabdus sp. ZW0627]